MRTEPTSLGSQWMTKGGTVPADIRRAIASTGGALSPEIAERVETELSCVAPRRRWFRRLLPLLAAILLTGATGAAL